MSINKNKIGFIPHPPSSYLKMPKFHVIHTFLNHIHSRCPYLLDSSLDVVFIGHAVHNEYQGVVILNQLHGRFSGERILDDFEAIHSGGKIKIKLNFFSLDFKCFP